MSNTRIPLRNLALGLAVAALWPGTLQAQPVLNPAWRVTPDASKPGFIFNIFANSDRGTRPNNNGTTENDLALGAVNGAGDALDNLADPGAVGVAIGPAAAANPSNASIQFEIDSLINMALTAPRGVFANDDLIPGLPASSGNNGFSTETLTYLTLPVGVITMGVQSDDSFGVQSGPSPRDAFGRVQLRAGEGGAQPQTIFTFQVTDAGTYPFRTIWQNGGGDAHIEWFSVKADSTKVLVNDVANGGIPAYRALVGSDAPYVKGVTPQAVPRRLDRISRNVSVLLADAPGNAVDDNSVTLQIDGKPATLTKTRQGSLLSVASGAPDGLRLAAEAHTGLLTFKNSTGTYSRSQAWTFHNLENLVLPASPVTGENFDSYPEATDPSNVVPPGWTVSNYTWLEVSPPAGFGGWDLGDNANDPFVNWIMIATGTVLPLEDEVLDNDKNQLVNGQPVTDWMSGNLIYAASDGRARRVSIGGANQPNDYAPQIQIVVSKAFDLSSVANPVLTFSSGVRISGNHEQDSLEYSVDDGATWLPGIIMQNAATVFLNADGTYDAVKMLTNKWADVARFPVVQDAATRDFVSAGPLGQKFGDVLLTPITPALAPYIANRNDNAFARRVEAIRLPAASKKSNVRLRMVHYGSCGWEWGIDNIAFYDIAPAVAAAPTLSIARSGNTVTITFEGALQQANSIGGTWGPASSSSPLIIPNPTGTKFYRAVNP